MHIFMGYCLGLVHLFFLPVIVAGGQPLVYYCYALIDLKNDFQAAFPSNLAWKRSFG